MLIAQKKATVRKFDGTSWVTFGTTDFSPNQIMGDAYIAFKQTNAVPYVAFVNDTYPHWNSTVMAYKADMPNASPTGNTYDSAQSVTLSSTSSGATIYYTINDDTPTTSSTQYTTPITVNSSQTIKAIAVKSGMIDSDIMSETYVLKAATPNSNIAAGTYFSAQSLTLSSTTSEATIYYTTNGDIPTISSTQYTTPITVSSSQTIKAIAIKDGITDSDIMIETYTITPASPMYRFQNKNDGTYLFVGENEKNGILDNYSQTFVLEGLAYYAPISGVPIYRFQNKHNGTYLFTGENEKNSVLAGYSETFNLEGLAFYTQAGSGTPMYRFQNKSNGTYLFVGENEKNGILENYSQTFKLEGLAFYAVN